MLITELFIINPLGRDKKIKRSIDIKARRNDKSQSICGSETRQAGRQVTTKKTQSCE